MSLPFPRPPAGLLHLWFRLTRGLTLGVRAVVIDRDGAVLLVRHSYLAGWHFPGGGVEIGETAGDALRRELAEEASVEMTGPARLHGVFHASQVSQRDHVLVYEVRQFRQTGPRPPDREIVDTGFFALDALPPGTTEATRRRLGEIVDGTPPSPIWSIA